MTYDLDGNLTNDGIHHFTYDAENRLTSVTPITPTAGSTKVEYAYDYMSRRVEKPVYTYDGSSWVLETEKSFTYDGWNLIQGETTQGGTTSTEYYVWGLDLSGTLQGPSTSLRTGSGGIGGLLSKTNNLTAKTYLYTFDANGKVGQLVDSSNGTIAAHYEYDPFGKLLVSTGSEADSNVFRFSTKYYDVEADLYYYGYRYYSPKLGRWVNRDPIGEQGGLNLYRFVRNHTLNEIDKLGLLGRRIFAGDHEKEYYSCNCGWIDNSHVKDSKKIYLKQIKKGIDEYECNRTKDTFIVESGTIGGAFIKVSYTVTFDGMLDPESKIQLALDIFFDFQIVFENFQGSLENLSPLTHSFFSVDDLPSDFLGFMEAAGKTTIQEICSSLSPIDSMRVFQAGNGPSTNKSHIPKLWKTELPEFAGLPRTIVFCDLCQGKETRIPDIFHQYKMSGNFPGPKGFIRNGIVDQQTILGNIF